MSTDKEEYTEYVKWQFKFGLNKKLNKTKACPTTLLWKTCNRYTVY